MSLKFKTIEYKETFPLRQQVLNPGSEGDQLKRPGDETAIHIGGFREDELVAIISLYQQNTEEAIQPGYWRIRGMAVRPKYQRKGIGTQLLKFALEYLKNSFTLVVLWCKSRKGAIGLYQQIGMEIQKVLQPQIPGYPQSYLMVVRFD